MRLLIKRTVLDTDARSESWERCSPKVFIPFIYKNRVWCLDESLWPISLEEFKGLNEQLIDKFPKIYAGHQEQTIAKYYQEIVRELEALE